MTEQPPEPQPPKPYTESLRKTDIQTIRDTEALLKKISDLYAKNLPIGEEDSRPDDWIHRVAHSGVLLTKSIAAASEEIEAYFYQEYLKIKDEK